MHVNGSNEIQIGFAIRVALHADHTLFIKRREQAIAFTCAVIQSRMDCMNLEGRGIEANEPRNSLTKVVKHSDIHAPLLQQTIAQKRIEHPDVRNAIEIIRFLTGSLAHAEDVMKMQTDIGVARHGVSVRSLLLL
jgi:hypothetical protein